MKPQNTIHTNLFAKGAAMSAALVVTTLGATAAITVLDDDLVLRDRDLPTNPEEVSLYFAEDDTDAGSNALYSWQSEQGAWVWGYDADWWTMFLSEDHVLKLYNTDTTAGTGNAASIILNPGDGALGLVPASITIDGDKVITEGNSVTLLPPLLANDFVPAKGSSSSLGSADSFLLEGTHGGPGGIPRQGAGSRMMWYPEKSAFRAGTISSSAGFYWDDSSTGAYSVAMGLDVLAAGTASAALGFENYAQGNYSFTAGAYSDASGDYSVALGNTASAQGEGSLAGTYSIADGIYSTALTGSYAYGDYSFAAASGVTNGDNAFAAVYGSAHGASSIAMGDSSNAYGMYSTVIGYNATANGDYSHAIGYFAEAYGESAFAGGYYSSAHGDYSSSLSGGYANGMASVSLAGSSADGEFSLAASYGAWSQGDYSIALGYNAYAIGDYSASIGNYTSATSYSSIALGFYNEDRHDSTDSTTVDAARQSWQGDDQHSVLEVGIGTDWNDKKNALTVLQDGSVEVGKATAADDSVPLHVKADGSVDVNGTLNVSGSEVLTQSTAPTSLSGLYVPRSSNNLGSDDSLLLEGTHGGGGSIPTEGAGSRMMWYPEKSAFRVGEVPSWNSSVWDDANIGDYSVAMGYNVLASGNNAVAMGAGAYASGSDSMAIGNYARGEGDYSVAIGSNAYTASGTYEALALMGGSANATNSMAVMYGEAYGDLSIAMAAGKADGASSIAIGGYDWNYGNWPANNSVGENSTAIGGVGAQTLGFSSFASGFWTKAAAGYSTALGSLNLGLGTGGDTWVETDPLFELGNGIAPRSYNEPDPVNRSNAVTILKNGQTTLSNKAWVNRDVNLVSATEDPSPETTDSGGNALVVEGHAVLKGKVIIEEVQGDISMGAFGN